VCTVEKISEHYLIAALQQLLETFPFTVLGFHSGNGSEYINKRAVNLLEKLRIEFTKSRSRQSNDNALVESKNGAVVLKYFGYVHIPQRWAPLINTFNRQHVNPYLNFHRPCFFSQTLLDINGKQRKTYGYEHRQTPYDKLKSLPQAKDYLKPGVSFEILDKLAHRISDNQAADELQKARRKLFNTIHGQTLKTAWQYLQNTALQTHLWIGIYLTADALKNSFHKLVKEAADVQFSQRCHPRRTSTVSNTSRPAENEPTRPV
jgi:hypothetical protein